MASAKQIEAFHEQGYFVTADAIEPDMLERLVAAAGRARDKARAGAGVLGTRSTRNGEGSDAEHIEGVVAPEFEEPDFAEYLASESLMRYVRAFIGDQMRMGWMTLCVNPSGYDSGWHRDVGGTNREARDQEELDILTNFMSSHFKWSLALGDDPCLLLIPGTHCRNATEEERTGLLEDKKADIPGQQEIFLKKGETLFWSGKTIHRGRAPADLAERLTIRAGMVRYDPEEGQEDLGERFAWMKADNIRDALPGSLRLPYDRWLAVQAT